MVRTSQDCASFFSSCHSEASPLLFWLLLCPWILFPPSRHEAQTFLWSSSLLFRWAVRYSPHLGMKSQKFGSHDVECFLQSALQVDVDSHLRVAFKSSLAWKWSAWRAGWWAQRANLPCYWSPWLWHCWPYTDHSWFHSAYSPVSCSAQLLVGWPVVWTTRFLCIFRGSWSPRCSKVC